MQTFVIYLLNCFNALLRSLSQDRLKHFYYYYYFFLIKKNTLTPFVTEWKYLPHHIDFKKKKQLFKSKQSIPHAQKVREYIQSFAEGRNFQKAFVCRKLIIVQDTVCYHD